VLALDCFCAPKDGVRIVPVFSGQLGLDRRCTLSAPRVAFFLVHGVWPEYALHGCDNPPCCNAESPAHVHDGTHVLNMAEMAERGLRKVWGREVRLETRRLYVEAGLTQREIAQRLGLGRATVSRWTHGLGQSQRDPATGRWRRV
jgi:DNA-binding XRE family transcriptional regulator